jgi:hypothetical protein
MLRKFFASWLVVLVLVPFTAPFSTCDLPHFFGSAQRHTPVSPPPSIGVRERRHHDEDFTTDAAGLSVRCTPTAGRVRLLPPSAPLLAHAKVFVPTARLIWSGASPGRIREHTVLTTILRL